MHMETTSGVSQSQRGWSVPGPGASGMLVRVGAAAVVMMFLGVSANAGSFWSKLNPFRYFSSKNKIHTLIITGNYSKSRLLAELIQVKSGQPILLISPTSTGAEELYFLPKGSEAVAVEKAKYNKFVDWLHPRRIVFLGDGRYVPSEFVDMVRERYPVFQLTSDDWTKNAEAAAKLFGNRKLARRYAELLPKVEAAPTVAPAGAGAVPAASMAAPAPAP